MAELIEKPNRIELTKEQSDKFFDCVKRLEGIKSSMELFKLSCDSVQSAVDLSHYVDFARRAENVFSYMAVGLDSVLFDLMDMIDY